MVSPAQQNGSTAVPAPPAPPPAPAPISITDAEAMIGGSKPVPPQIEAVLSGYQDNPPKTLDDIMAGQTGEALATPAAEPAVEGEAPAPVEAAPTQTPEQIQVQKDERKAQKRAARAAELAIAVREALNQHQVEQQRYAPPPPSPPPPTAAQQRQMFEQQMLEANLNPADVRDRVTFQQAIQLHQTQQALNELRQQQQELYARAQTITLEQQVGAQVEAAVSTFAALQPVTLNAIKAQATQYVLAGHSPQDSIRAALQPFVPLLQQKASNQAPAASRHPSAAAQMQAVATTGRGAGKAGKLDPAKMDIGQFETLFFGTNK